LSANNRIFLSIAAYRDPQLQPTIRDCLRKALDPDQLVFGICWQHGPEEPPLLLEDDPRFRILDVDWRESKGACWARAETMKLWSGEAWFLQVDSHCRFAAGWDRMLIRAMQQTGSAKPILSTYANPFTPGGAEVLHGGPLQMIFQAFTPEGIPQLRPGEFAGVNDSTRPRRARFLSAGFLFCQGSFVEEVPYDPELYFMGEEAAMTVRAFTHGYDLFHPAGAVIWHDYMRTDAKKHWGDHTEANFVAKPWSERDEASKRKVQRLLLGEPMEDFGLGPARSLQEYEAYAGLSFRLRKVQQATLRGLEPPNANEDEQWPDRVHLWIARARFNREQLPQASLEDPILWCLTILDEEGYEICRRDVTPSELAPFQRSEGESASEQLALVCEFTSETIPAKWTLLPLSKSKGWMRKIGGQLNAEDFAVLKEDEALHGNRSLSDSTKQSA
jgi:hypothetical protein